MGYPRLHSSQVLFSIYHYSLTKRVSGPSPYSARNIEELQTAFKRVLRAGLYDYSEDDISKETSDITRPGGHAETIEKLEYDNPRAVDFRNMLRTWFGGAPWSSIRRHEVDLWLYWTIFNAHLPPADCLPPSHRAALDDALELLQMRAGSIIPEGSAPSIRPMLLTLDKVDVTWRPFMWYASITLVNWLARMWFEHKYHVSFGSRNGLE
jgi:hypothetical protein